MLEVARAVWVKFNADANLLPRADDTFAGLDGKYFVLFKGSNINSPMHVLLVRIRKLDFFHRWKAFVWRGYNLFFEFDELWLH